MISCLLRGWGRLFTVHVLPPLCSGEVEYWAQRSERPPAPVLQGFQGAVHYAELETTMQGVHNSSACIAAAACLPLGSHSVWCAARAHTGAQLHVAACLASVQRPCRQALCDQLGSALIPLWSARMASQRARTVLRCVETNHQLKTDAMPALCVYQFLCWLVVCRAALPPLPPPGGAGAAGSGKPQRPLPITLVVASIDGGGLFHDAIVVRTFSTAYAVPWHVLACYRAFDPTWS